MCDVIIIGAGASGIVSSIFAKRKNNKVIVLERNDKSLNYFRISMETKKVQIRSNKNYK